MIRYIYDESGNIVTTYTYDAWGRQVSVTGSNVTLGNLNPIRYKSYFYDSDTGFYYLETRFYDPTVERFLSPDPIVFDGYFDGGARKYAYNMYVYCANDPITFYDSTGKSVWFLIPVFVAVVILLPGCSSKTTSKSNTKTVTKYTPRYNSLYSNPSNAPNYNCYAYALSRTDRIINPGYFSNRKCTFNVEVLKDIVLADLKALKYKTKVVDEKYKPSQTAILKLNAAPKDYSVWSCEYYVNGAWGFDSDTYYDSKIIVYWR